MLNYGEYKPEQTGAEATAKQTWLERRRVKRERQDRRNEESERFARHRRMVMGATVDAWSVEKNRD